MYASEARNVGIALHTGVTIGYDVPWPKVQELLLTAARVLRFHPLARGGAPSQEQLDKIYRDVSSHEDVLMAL
mgnify:CR=1 FL=1